MSRLAALPAATALLLSSAVSVSADPGPADPGGVTPVAATVPGPAGPAAPPPVGAGTPPVDDGRIASSPPATSTLEGVTLTISSSNETVTPIAPLTTAVSTREYVVGGLFTGSIAGASTPPEGVLEVGYQIGCGIDMSTSGGVLVGISGQGSIGTDAFTYGQNGYFFLPIGTAGAGGSIIPSVAVSLKTGVVNTIPVDKKTYKTPAPEIKVTGFRVKIDGCVGQSFIRSYAILTNSTSAQAEDLLSWYGVTKAV
jgi:hypothetical protein